MKCNKFSQQASLRKHKATLHGDKHIYMQGICNLFLPENTSKKTQSNLLARHVETYLDGNYI